MAQAAYKLSGFPREPRSWHGGRAGLGRVFRAFIADELRVSVENVTAFVLGRTWANTMVSPAPFTSTVAGIPITELDREIPDRKPWCSGTAWMVGAENRQISENRLGLITHRRPAATEMG